MAEFLKALFALVPGTLIAAYSHLAAHWRTALIAGAPLALAFAGASYYWVRAHAEIGAIGPMLLFGLLFFIAMPPALAAHYRLALKGEAPGLFGLSFGRDEIRILQSNLLMASFMIIVGLILIMPVVAPIMAADYLAAGRAGLDPVDESGSVGAAYYTWSEWLLVGGAVTGVTVLLVWLVSRLSFAAPSSLMNGRVQLLSAWGVTRKRGAPVALALAAALAPALVFVLAFSAALSALTGQHPFGSDLYSEGGLAPATGPLLFSGLLLGVVICCGVLPVFCGAVSALYRRLQAETGQA
jgi:hypothetical protein